MPQKFLNQVKWLCKEIPKVEWSGVLFYSIEGSIQDPKNMTITLEEILPMQKGTAAYTEYSFDERVVNFMMDTPEADDWKIGHIHSHNTMQVYFSGTDWSELEDNSPNHNFYVSLIVNNFMDFCAKVAFIAESGESTFVAKNENGEKYDYGLTTDKIEKLITYDCNIITPESTITVEESFKEKVKGIVAEAAKVPARHTSRYAPTIGGTPTKPLENRWKPKNFSDRGFDDSWGFQSVPKTSFQEMQEEMQEELELEMITEFTMFVLNTGNDLTAYKDIEEVVQMYVAFGVTPNALASGVLDKYTVVYNKFFDKHTDKDDPNKFISITEKVLEELYGEIFTSRVEKVKEMLLPVQTALENMLTKYKKYEHFTG